MFSRPGTYPAVGLFSTAHIISIFVCFIIIGLAVFFTRKMTKDTYIKFLRILAIVVTCLELFKVIWTLSIGDTNVNAWVPLYFCSIFIYSLWFTYSKKQFVREIGLSFIAFAGIMAGVVFIISPATSFNNYPIFHFNCLYSMIYHSLMVYSGIMLIKTKAVKFNMKLFYKYLIFCAIFMTLAIIVNVCTTDGNMMFFDNLGGLSIPILVTIYNFSHVLYTIVMVLAHLLLGLVVLGVYKLIELIVNKCKQSKAKNVTTQS